jgi:hypothetical protein
VAYPLRDNDADVAFLAPSGRFGTDKLVRFCYNPFTSRNDRPIK